MASNADHESMYLASTPALTYPADLRQIHLDSARAWFDHQPSEPLIAGESRETLYYEEKIPLPLPQTSPSMPIRSPLRWFSPDAPTHVAHVEGTGGTRSRPRSNPQTDTGSDDTCPGLQDPTSTSSESSHSTRPVTPDDVKPHADPIHGVSNPTLRRSPSKHLRDICRALCRNDFQDAYASFLRAYPEYRLTQPIDDLRKREYKRLKQSEEVYMDYMGASLYPESLIRSNSAFLRHTVLGNTHSVSASSHQSAMCAEEARSSVLAFFDAPPSKYTVIFTPNATGAMRLVGESFPFVRESSYVLGADSHNSINGIRQFALAKGARVAYIPSTSQGGMDESEAKSALRSHSPKTHPSDPPCLFALTGSSNVTNSKNRLSLLAYASNLGYNTLLDAAALAPSSKISLRATPADAMAISFYKMFGFPTGVGCLVAKKSFLRQLKRPWFAGGTVSVVQVPGAGFTPSHEIYEQFEDGTINFASLAAITRGISLLSEYIDYLPVRLSTLTHYLVRSLTAVKHDTSNTLVAQVVSRRPGKRPSAVGEQSETGSIVSVIFLEPSGEMMPNSFVEYAATKHKISLRTGCMCNPGGAAGILGFQSEMEKFSPGITYDDFENIVGRKLGVVRLSMGLASHFSDVYHVLRFVREVIACEVERKKLWAEWNSHGHNHS